MNIINKVKSKIYILIYAKSYSVKGCIQMMWILCMTHTDYINFLKGKIIKQNKKVLFWLEHLKLTVFWFKMYFNAVRPRIDLVWKWTWLNKSPLNSLKTNNVRFNGLSIFLSCNSVSDSDNRADELVDLLDVVIVLSCCTCWFFQFLNKSRI